MICTSLRRSLMAALAVVLLGGGSHLWATSVSYTVDPLRSSLSVSGTWYGLPIEEVSNGSLTTSYTGSIQADLTSTTIQFTGASLGAENSGDYRPKAHGDPGQAAANYGGIVSIPFRLLRGDVLLALRDLNLGLSSPELGLLPGQAFDAGGLTAGVSGALDYAGVGLFGALGRNQAPIDLAGLHNSKGIGGISQTSNIETLEFPIDITFTPAAIRPGYRPYSAFPIGAGGFRLHLEGTIFATSQRPGNITPEPATALLLASGAVVVLRRRRARDVR